MTYNIAIIGYGMAGIAAAIYARRQGHVVTHFERAKLLESQGAGMLLHPPAQLQLAQLGVLSEALSIGSKVNGIKGYSNDEKCFLDFSYGEKAGAKFGLGIQRGALHQILRGAADGDTEVHTFREITRVDCENGYLYNSKETPFGSYDLIIIANGMFSTLSKNLRIPICLLYTSPSPRDATLSRMPSSA